MFLSPQLLWNQSIIAFTPIIVILRKMNMNKKVNFLPLFESLHASLLTNTTCPRIPKGRNTNLTGYGNLQFCLGRKTIYLLIVWQYRSKKKTQRLGEFKPYGFSHLNHKLHLYKETCFLAGHITKVCAATKDI